MELVIREDGGLRLTCGRGTDTFPRQTFPSPDRSPMAVIAMLVLGLTHSVVALAGRLADEYASYQGQWQLGIRMDHLRGAVPLDLLQGGPGNPCSRGEYEKVVSASTEELLSAPYAVTGRLVAQLLRGLGIGPRYLQALTKERGGVTKERVQNGPARRRPGLAHGRSTWRGCPE